ncbi:MAG: mannitol-/sugar-/sorbitol-6-phosphatase [Actinomycetota bacterium]|nr:mannitol-/sugar-/sorbitol-6-phosphatase [Actinomycetota bacterium]
MNQLEITLPDADPLRCSAILFDMDGVLVDSIPLIEKHLRAWAEHHSLDPRKVIQASPGRTNEELVREVAPHLDPLREGQLLLEREVADVEGLQACPGACRLLGSMPADQWAVVTSGHRPVAMNRLEAAGLPLPGILVTADDVLRGKPDPEGCLSAAHQLGVSPQDCLVIEDAAAGILAARAAGMLSLLVTRTSDGHASGDAPHDLSVASLDLLGLRVDGNALPG